MFNENESVAKQPEKSIAHLIYEKIENLPPARAKEELMQARDMYHSQLKNQLEKTAELLKQYEIQIKEFRS